MNIQKTTTETGFKDAARKLIELVNAQPGQVLLLLSGGSSLNIPNFLLCRDFNNPVTVLLGDDRFSRKEDENSFLTLSCTTLMTNTTDCSHVTFISTTPNENESLEDFGVRYEQVILDWQLKYPGGSIIALFGVGEDGHLAGMMPFLEKEEWEKLFLSTKNAVSYDAKHRSPYPLRATITGSFIQKSITCGIAFALGAKKERIIQRLINEDIPYHTMPAQLLKTIPNCTLITDCSI